MELEYDPAVQAVQVEGPAKMAVQILQIETSWLDSIGISLLFCDSFTSFEPSVW